MSARTCCSDFNMCGSCRSVCRNCGDPKVWSCDSCARGWCNVCDFPSECTICSRIPKEDRFNEEDDVRFHEKICSACMFKCLKCGLILSEGFHQDNDTGFCKACLQFCGCCKRPLDQYIYDEAKACPVGKGLCGQMLCPTCVDDGCDRCSNCFVKWMKQARLAEKKLVKTR